MKKRISLFDIINYGLLGLYAALCFYSLWNIIVVSFSTLQSYNRDMYHIIPYGYTLDNYKRVFLEDHMISGFFNSVKITTIGSPLGVFFAAMGGYAFSKRHLPGIKTAWKFVILTMYFSGGMVPSYLMVTGLGLKDSTWALILPMVVNTFYIIVCRTYFMELPASLEESAKIEGANEFVVLFRIIIPMSKPMMAAILLFFAVEYWNNFILAVFYIQDYDKIPLQLVIRNLLKGMEFSRFMPGATEMEAHMEGKVMAAVMFCVLPIISVYPWLQKYFIKGVMIGAVKE